MITKAVKNVLYVQGSIKGSYELEFEKALEEIAAANPEEDIIVDMQKVNHMNSYALGALIRFKKVLNKNITVKNPSQQVTDLLYVTNLDKVIKVIRPKAV